MAGHSIRLVSNTSGAGTPARQRGPSQTIWSNCPVLEFIEDPNRGVYLFDDFLDYGVNPDGYGRPDNDLTGSSSTLTSPATFNGGLLRITNSGTADYVANIATSAMGTFSQLDQSRLWWEIRTMVNSVTNLHSKFWGLVDTALWPTISGWTAGTPAVLSQSNYYAGFYTISNAPSTLLFHWKNGDAGTSISLGTILASTWYKLGGYYDGKFLYIYMDGLEVARIKDLPESTASYSTNQGASWTTGTTFPSTRMWGLGVGAIAGNAGTAAVQVNVDWWRFAREMNE